LFSKKRPLLTFIFSLKSSNHHIKWVPAGDAFRISDLQRLENETLPSFFRHSRFQSLVRQLNFYNFRKVNRERNFWIYRHKQFHRDRPQQLHLLRRRTCPGVDGRKQRPDNESSNRGKLSVESNSKGKYSSSSEYSSFKENSIVDENMKMYQRQTSLKNQPEARISREGSHQSLLYACTQPDRFGGETGPWIQDSIKFQNTNSSEHEILSSASNYEKSFKSHEKQFIEVGMNSINQHRSDRGQMGTLLGKDDDVKMEFVSNYPPNDIYSYNLENESKSCVTPGDEGKTNVSLMLSSMERRSSGTEGQGFKIAEKLSRAELNKHSLLVSQVARELEIYARRAAETGTKVGKGRGRGRRSGILVVDGRGAGGLVTPPPVLGDTMRYNALTYDDEYSRLEIDGRESIENCKSEVVVTDESDNSESDDIVSERKKEPSMRPESDKKTNENTQKKNISTSNCELNFGFVVEQSTISSISKKLLNGIGLQDSTKSCNFHLLSASLVYFCLSNSPLDPGLGCKIHLLLETCNSLRDDFFRYRRALFPGPPCFLKSSISSDRSKETSQRCDVNTVRDFKVFASNCMEDTLCQNKLCKEQSLWPFSSLLNEEEAKVLRVCKNMWCRSIIGKD